MRFRVAIALVGDFILNFIFGLLVTFSAVASDNSLRAKLVVIGALAFALGVSIQWPSPRLWATMAARFVGLSVGVWLSWTFYVLLKTTRWT